MIALLFIIGGVLFFLLLLWVIFATVAGPRPKAEPAAPAKDIQNADMAELLRLREEEREKAESLKNLTLVAAARKRIAEIDARLEKLRGLPPSPDA